MRAVSYPDSEMYYTIYDSNLKQYGAGTTIE